MSAGALRLTPSGKILKSFDVLQNLHKKLFPRILRMCRMSFKFEYLGKIDNVFKTNLRYDTGDQVGSVLMMREKNQ